MNYFFIGIKGAGMAALAVMLKESGAEVTGVDVKHYIFTEDKLKGAGISYQSFDSVVGEHDVYIYSTAFKDCLLVNDLINQGKRIYEYHEFVAFFSTQYRLVAISGTHGKTTTSTLMYHMLSEFSTTAAIIGEGHGAYALPGSWLVLEACEYKNHFLSYSPDVAIINNVDYDHSDFFKTVEEYHEAFNNFAKRSKSIIYNGDELRYDGISYGIKDNNIVRAANIISNSDGVNFDLYIKKRFVRNVSLPFYGMHMIYNVLAVLAVAYFYQVDIDKAITGIKRFNGVSRRFKESIVNSKLVIDDYAHHPSAIKATIQAVRTKYPEKKIIAFFQPDRYSRIISFANEFRAALQLADFAYVLPFPTNAPREEKMVDASILSGENISYMEELKKQSELTEDVVYLFMSSKDQQNNIKTLIFD